MKTNTHPLTGFRTANAGRAYSPSPVVAGLCLMGIGLSLILGSLTEPVIRHPRWWFYHAKSMLVWVWTGQRNYSAQQARVAYVATAVSLLGLFVLGLMLYAIGRAIGSLL